MDSLKRWFRGLSSLLGLAEAAWQRISLFLAAFLVIAAIHKISSPLGRRTSYEPPLFAGAGGGGSGYDRLLPAREQSIVWTRQANAILAQGQVYETRLSLRTQEGCPKGEQEAGSSTTPSDGGSANFSSASPSGPSRELEPRYHRADGYRRLRGSASSSRSSACSSSSRSPRPRGIAAAASRTTQDRIKSSR